MHCVHIMCICIYILFIRLKNNIIHLQSKIWLQCLKELEAVTVSVNCKYVRMLHIKLLFFTVRLCMYVYVRTGMRPLNSLKV